MLVLAFLAVFGATAADMHKTGALELKNEKPYVEFHSKNLVVQPAWPPHAH